MLKIDLFDPKTGDIKHYEQPRVSFGDFKRVLAFDKLTAQNEAKRKILSQKLEAGTLTDKEAKEYVKLSSTSEEELNMMEDIIVSLFHNPKVTKKSLEEGLDSNGIEVLKQVLTDAMGGIKADANHPAKK